MSMETAQFARDMVRLERLAKQEWLNSDYPTEYWLTPAWEQREEIPEHRSTLLRAEWRERRMAQRSSAA